MPIHIRADGEVVVLSNFGRLMDDPKHFDARRDVEEMLDQGFMKFILELRGVGTMGASGFGLLMTITRLIRKQGGEVVLASPSRGMEKLLDEMQMDDYWEVCEGIDEAKDYLDRMPS
jgi:anti-sigma B factor antagonist